MDVDFKPPHQENGAKKEEDLVQKEKAPPDADSKGVMKESPKQNTRPKRGPRRSRSRTPQKKSDEAKTLQVSLKKMSTELNGKDLKEEVEKTEENKGGENVSNDTTVNEENSIKANESKNEKTEKESQKQKEDHPNKEENNKKDDNQEKGEVVKNEEPKKVSPRKEKKEKTKKQELSQTSQTNDAETDAVEMDPLIISDEPDPELQFDENSDMESGKGSPVISRCVTRRSLTRNIPTPKTPKSVEQDIDSEKNSIANTPTDLIENDTELPKMENLNDSHDLIDTGNLSTQVEVGSDLTRMDYIENHNSNLAEDTSYLNATRERSLGETLRSLSARRPIRPLNDYRRRTLRANQEKSDLNMPYSSYHTVEQITTGLKRKSRSTTPEDRKKFKSDSPSINSLFSSPLTNLRNKFRSDLPSSTPKLLGYRDSKSELHYNDEQNMVHNGDDEKKSWCSVM